MLIPASLQQLVNQEVASTNEQFIAYYKNVIEHQFPALLPGLEKQALRALKEPMLISLVADHTSALTIPQVVCGYMDPTQRPDTLAVQSDRLGTVWLPGMGAFTGVAPNQNFTLHFNGQQPPALMAANQPVQANFTAAQYLEGTQIELMPCYQASYDYLFSTRGVLPTFDTVPQPISQFLPALQEATDLIKEYYPWYYQNLLATTARLMVYQHPTQLSFADWESHGTGYLNSYFGEHMLFFLEDILHQCAHVIFYAVTVDRESFFTVPYNDALYLHTDHDVNEYRLLYGSYHGLFTQSCINCFYDIALEKGLFKGHELHEVHGRLSDNMKRFDTALQWLGRESIYTERGLALYNTFKDIHRALDQKYHDLVHRFDTNNQPYLFSYRKFTSLNPYPGTEPVPYPAPQADTAESSGHAEPILPQGLQCLACGHVNTLALENGEQLRCTHCQATYPMPYGRIPLLVPEATPYTASMMMHYAKHVKFARTDTQNARNRAEHIHDRQEAMQAHVTAMEYNLEAFERMKESLRPYVSLDDVLDLLDNQEQTVLYAMQFQYMWRDWSHSPEAEAEVASIMDGIEQVLGPVSHNPQGMALVLGSGTGRIAAQVAHRHEQVISMDRSYTMAWLLDQVIQGPFSFYEYHGKNVTTVERMTRLHHLQYHKPENAPGPAPAPKEKVFNMVADALHLPLANESVDTIYSVYFTDVLHLEKLMPELRRVLKPGGRFVHFGPLEYHFTELNHMLSAEEVKAAFEKAGFTVEKEGGAETTHGSYPDTMITRHYHNWAFSAQKQPEFALAAEHTVELAGPVKYRVLGHVEQQQQVTDDVQLELPNGETYDGAGSVIEILNFVQGPTKVQDLLNALGQEFEMDDEMAAQILGILTELTQKGLLKVV